ncbi:MAG: aldolase/citrate lyase family protein [Candidatus Latescibacterota bacterium]|nr:aldolase/citrate lyase family protein [Candidatus Latescibacterota bacterium]
MAQGLKAKIRSGEQTLGFGLRYDAGRQQFEQALEGASYDFVFVDGQHSPLSEERLVEFCNIADNYDLPVRFRIKHPHDAYLVGNMLDLGPTGIEVPLVESAMTAHEVVESFYFPPIGRRSNGGAARRHIENFPQVNDYVAWWNDNGVLWLQVESMQGVLHAHGMALPEVDCLSFGPTDLTLDIESHPNPPYSTLEACVEAVARSVEGTQTAICYRNGSPDTRQHWADLGVTVFLEAPVSR